MIATKSLSGWKSGWKSGCEAKIGASHAFDNFDVMSTEKYNQRVKI